MCYTAMLEWPCFEWEYREDIREGLSQGNSGLWKSI